MMAGALTVRLRYGKARPTLPGTTPKSHENRKVTGGMVKPEWGTKRSCPKCGTRFYDLGEDDPVTCINCGAAWAPEPILKSKQPLPFDAPKPEPKKDEDLAGDDEDMAPDEDEEPSADDEVDLGGDDDLGVETSNEDDDN